MKMRKPSAKEVIPKSEHIEIVFIADENPYVFKVRPRRYQLRRVVSKFKEIRDPSPVTKSEVVRTLFYYKAKILQQELSAFEIGMKTGDVVQVVDYTPDHVPSPVKHHPSYTEREMIKIERSAMILDLRKDNTSIVHSVYLNIKCIDERQRETHFRMRRTTKLNVLFDKYCADHKAPRGKVQFMFDGRFLDGKHTAAHYQMYDDAVVEIYSKEIYSKPAPTKAPEKHGRIINIYVVDDNLTKKRMRIRRTDQLNIFFQKYKEDMKYPKSDPECVAFVFQKKFLAPTKKAREYHIMDGDTILCRRINWLHHLFFSKKCWYCFEEAPDVLTTCKKCNVLTYCDGCQDDGYTFREKEHKRFCKIFGEIGRTIQEKQIMAPYAGVEDLINEILIKGLLTLNKVDMTLFVEAKNYKDDKEFKFWMKEFRKKAIFMENFRALVAEFGKYCLKLKEKVLDIEKRKKQKEAQHHFQELMMEEKSSKKGKGKKKKKQQQQQKSKKTKKPKKKKKKKKKKAKKSQNSPMKASEKKKPEEKPDSKAPKKETEKQIGGEMPLEERRKMQLQMREYVKKKKQIEIEQRRQEEMRIREEMEKRRKDEEEKKHREEQERLEKERKRQKKREERERERRERQEREQQHREREKRMKLARYNPTDFIHIEDDGFRDENSLFAPLEAESGNDAPKVLKFNEFVEEPSRKILQRPDDDPVDLVDQQYNNFSPSFLGSQDLGSQDPKYDPSKRKTLAPVHKSPQRKSDEEKSQLDNSATTWTPSSLFYRNPFDVLRPGTELELEEENTAPPPHANNHDHTHQAENVASKSDTSEDSIYTGDDLWDPITLFDDKRIEPTRENLFENDKFNIPRKPPREQSLFFRNEEATVTIERRRKQELERQAQEAQNTIVELQNEIKHKERNYSKKKNEFEDIISNLEISRVQNQETVKNLQSKVDQLNDMIRKKDHQSLIDRGTIESLSWKHDIRKMSLQELMRLRDQYEKQLTERRQKLQRVEENIRQHFFCGLCKTNLKSVVLIECGHLVCQMCSRKIHNKCPYDGKRVVRTLKIIF